MLLREVVGVVEWKRSWLLCAVVPTGALLCWACERGVASSTLAASALLSPRMTQVCVLSVWCFIRLQTCRLQHREKPALTPLQFAVRFGIMQPLFWM